jgi:hypothetical protein
MRDLLESLDSIAEQDLDERVTYSTLAKLSGIENPDKIYPGQKITLPGGGSYTVKRGDTLSGIAQDYRLGNIGKSGPDGKYDGDDLGNAPTTKKGKGPDPLNIMNPSPEVRAKVKDRPKQGGADPLGIFSPKNKAEPKATKAVDTKPVDQTAQITNKYNAIKNMAGDKAADVFAKGVQSDPRASQDTKNALPNTYSTDKDGKITPVSNPIQPKMKPADQPKPQPTPTKQQRADSLYQQIKSMVDAKPSTSGQMKRFNTGDKK